MGKKHNFGAGPGILAEDVIKQAAEGILDLNKSGLSVLEISHRSADFTAIIEEAESLVRELLEIPAGYSIGFLSGGASTQFALIPYNFLPTNTKAAYLNTGVWSKKAIKEARNFGEVLEVASSADKNFSYIPGDYSIPKDASYFHVTSNNTIYGTQIKKFPSSPVPMICDMSSDIFSRKLNVADFSMIYAGAQKNMGPAGTTLVIIKDDLHGKSGRTLPSMFDYKLQLENKSLFNTPPVFAIYVCLLNLRWLKKLGGMEKMADINAKKAGLLYEELDKNPLFKGTVEKADRSPMNVTFLLTNESLEEDFNKMIKEAGIIGIKGHRSVGGYRASLYNALPLESVQVLVEVMKSFALKAA